MVKDILREIKSKWFQFVAILIITALGVGFFVGIRVTGFDMRATADKYMETSDVLDLEYRHSLGIDDAMIVQLSDIANSEAVGIYDTDSFVGLPDVDGVARVIELNHQTSLDLTLKSGRLPQAPNEAVLDNLFHTSRGLELGDVVKIKANDIFEETELTVVGFANSSLYMNLERGSSSIGSGNVMGFIYAQGLEHKVDVFTSARFALHETSDIKATKKLLEDNETEISEARFGRVVEPILQELADAQKELDEGRETANLEFADAQVKLDDAKRQLDSASTSIDSGLAEMAKGMNAQLAPGSQQEKLDTLVRLTNGLENNEKVQLTEGIQKINEGLAQIDAGLKEIDGKLAELDAAIAYLESLIAQGAPGLEAQLEEAKAGKVLVQTERDKIVAQQAQLIAQRTSLENSLMELNASLVSLRSAQAEMQSGIKAYDSGISSYNSGVRELEENKVRIYAELDDAQVKIDDGHKEIEETDRGKQYILNRDDVLIGYKEFYQDSDRIEAIGEVFPLIFFGVAILVTLSTISRMIDESRSQIGVYKALGYSWFYSSMKFVGFAFFSWFIGSVLGMIVGFYAIPNIIYNAYRIMYRTPDLVMGITWSYAWYPLIISFVSSVGVAMYKAFRVSRETTANLLRPPVPKSGQRILLERITPLWNRLSFLYKVSFRNLFRNKTRFLMTVIGIGGCAGLLITGFGIRYSIHSIVDKQFDDIIRYDGMVMYDKEIDVSNITLDDSIYASSEMITVDGLDVQMFAIDDYMKFDQFMNFKDRKTKKAIPYDNDTVFITEKLSILKKIKVGDSITFKIGDKEYQAKVGGISENYVVHYMYMSDEMYEKIVGKEPVNNLMIFKSTQDHESFATELLNQDKVFSVNFMDEMRVQSANMMGNFDIVIVVVVGAAFALELIVLMNLITMNMSERRKELATLKVLGFYPNELSTYIMRENIILTFISLFFGVVFGYYLHQFVILQAELDAIMFNRELLPSSIIIAVVITFVISVIINLFMSKRANNVNMSEALKTFDE